MKRWLALLPLVVLVGLAMLFAGWALNRDPAYKPDALVGQPVPETVLPMLTGDVAGPGQVDIRTAGVGRPMLVNVFASWCAPCRIEHPALMALKDQGMSLRPPASSWTSWVIRFPWCWSMPRVRPGWIWA